MPFRNLHSRNHAFFSKSPFRCLHLTNSTTQLRFTALQCNKIICDHDSELLLLRWLSQKELQKAREVLHEVPHSGNRGVVVAWTRLLSKYARDGFIDEARTLFELLPVRNIVTYNAMLSGYMQSGMIIEACKFFDEMREKNVVSWTSLLTGFIRAGRMDDAKTLFNCMPDRNVVSWNSMMWGLIRNGDLVEGRILFDAMPVRNQVSWNIMISGYAENCRMEEARGLFDTMTKHDVVTWTSLITGYCRSGDVEEGYKMFERMPERNVVSWTAMISGFTWNGFYKEALLLFLEMMKNYDVRPNEETFISLIYACSGLSFPQLGMQIHAHLILNGLDGDDYDGRLSKGLIHMYCEFGFLDFSHHIFTKNIINKFDIQSSNYMINGYIRIGCLEKARKLFEMLPFQDQISWTSLITGYFHTGNVKEACSLFNRMPERDSIVWTVMVSGHIQNELFSEAMQLFSNMRLEGFMPLNSTYSALLGAAGATANLIQGKQLHCLLIKTQPNLDIILENSLISMYAKCGDINDAYSIFCSMTRRDTVTWNSMIMSFSHHGLSKKTLEIFDMMLNAGCKPNSITFLGVLTACIHAGMVDQAWKLFNSMSQKYSIQPGTEHYVCIVDLLGRAGKVKEAEEFVMNLPFEPGLPIWGALLGVSSFGELNAEIASHAVKQVLKLDPINAPAHVLLCNIYAATGQHSNEVLVRKDMELKGVRKAPGCSWIILKGETHVFLSGDRSHSQAGEIFGLLAGAEANSVK